jgi:hypothetical protein
VATQDRRVSQSALGRLVRRDWTLRFVMGERVVETLVWLMCVCAIAHNGYPCHVGARCRNCRRACTFIVRESGRTMSAVSSQIDARAGPPPDFTIHPLPCSHGASRSSSAAVLFCRHAHLKRRRNERRKAWQGHLLRANAARTRRVSSCRDADVAGSALCAISSPCPARGANGDTADTIRRPAHRRIESI